MQRKHRPSQERTLRTDRITRDLANKTVVLIAGGPSLTAAQCLDVRMSWIDCRVHVIGVNDAYRIAPWIDGLYACDPRWWDHHIDDIRKIYLDELMTINRASAEKYGLWFIRGLVTTPGEQQGLSTDSGYIHTGGNSGFQALNIAILRGAKRIILLGYDMQMGYDGMRHWFGDHPGRLNLDSKYDTWLPEYEAAARQAKELGVEIINCSPASALTCFPKKRLAAALP